jgi:hypothetical protein
MNARRLLFVFALVALFEALFPMPAWLRTTSFALSAVLAGVVATTSLKTLMDRVLAALLGVVLILIVLGFLLHLSPWGLTQRSWTMGWALILLGTGLLTGHHPTLRLSLRLDRALVGWSLASLLVVLAAFGVALGVSGSERATPLSLSVVSTSAAQVKLLVAGPVDRRDLSLVQIDGDTRQTIVTIDLSSRKPFEMVMPKPTVRVSIALVDGKGAVQRTVIVDPALATAPKK